ncbi:MAG: hypothetical protein JETCAE02_06190 [Anaerolineaceae bacterium]|nr:MAG: hypothetical protein BroJett001_12020 [Chloroflexota bacterium]GJQ38207.1 MAG: hypothetical protein JETCAE02_06190 [Anaerolineaceae bacterium]
MRPCLDTYSVCGYGYIYTDTTYKYICSHSHSATPYGNSQA